MDLVQPTWVTLLPTRSGKVWRTCFCVPIGGTSFPARGISLWQDVSRMKREAALEILEGRGEQRGSSTSAVVRGGFL
jgi:hypothetical protein